MDRAELGNCQGFNICIRDLFEAETELLVAENKSASGRKINLVQGGFSVGAELKKTVTLVAEQLVTSVKILVKDSRHLAKRTLGRSRIKGADVNQMDSGDRKSTRLNSSHYS